MVAWSNLLRPACQILSRKPWAITRQLPKTVQVRCMSSHERVLDIKPSRWQWNKAKDLLHFYVMVGLIPICVVVFLVDVFIGPATLEPIPEGYTPKHWEYYRHPIERFFARYVYTSLQEEHEKFLYGIYEEQQSIKYRKLEKRIKDLMKQRHDYQAMYYRPYQAGKYVYEFNENEVAEEWSRR